MTGYIRAGSCFLLLLALILQGAGYFLLYKFTETVRHVAGLFVFDDTFTAPSVRFAFYPRAGAWIGVVASHKTPSFCNTAAALRQIVQHMIC